MDKDKKADLLLRRYDLEEEVQAVLRDLTQRGETLKRLGKDLTDNARRVRVVENPAQGGEVNPAEAGYSRQTLAPALDLEGLTQALERLQQLLGSLGRLREEFEQIGLRWREPG